MRPTPKAFGAAHEGDSGFQTRWPHRLQAYVPIGPGRADYEQFQYFNSLLAQARQLPCYENLLQLPGVGRVLSMTINNYFEALPFETRRRNREKKSGRDAFYCFTRALMGDPHSP